MLWDYFRIPLDERLRSGSLKLKECHEALPYWMTGDVAFVHSLSRR